MTKIDRTSIPCVRIDNSHLFQIVGRYLIYNNHHATLSELKKGFANGAYLHYESYWCFCLNIIDEYDYLEFTENGGWQKLKDYIQLYKDDIKNKEKWHKIIDDIDEKSYDFSYCAIIDALIKQKLFIKKLSKCQSSSIRRMLAEQGLALSKLINDTDDYVRQAVAGQGYGLSILVNDRSVIVRTEVAKQGTFLDKLVCDKSPDVRCEVAKHGYALDTLINDTSPYVRATVAKQGYGLDVLFSDKSPIVRKVIALYPQYACLLKDDKVGTVREVALQTLSRKTP